jgi:hypothetical protein
MTPDRLIELQGVIRNVHLSYGEALLMINRMSGNNFETLPDNQIDEWKDFFVNNAFRRTEILSPEIHAACMAYPGEFGEQYRIYHNTNGQHGKKMCTKENLEEFFKELNFEPMAV